jgi:putative phosphoesterase
MKIAVLSDIHGNVPALEAVLNDIDSWRPDEVIINGDLVNRGPYSLDCLRLIQARFPACHFIKGNHESWILTCHDEPLDLEDCPDDLRRMGYWTYAQLGTTVEAIQAWADHFELTALEGQASFHVTHGSRLGNQNGIYPETADEDLKLKLGDPRDLFIASHTHRPLVRQFNGTLVVNTGSVGQPFDGDPRAAYGRFTLRSGKWHAEIARVEYDKIRAEQDFITSGFLTEAGSLARLIQLEHRECRVHVARWRRRYLTAVQASEISLTDAVDAYLASL